jgi:OmpA-OmpF porin, OOP family
MKKLGKTFLLSALALGLVAMANTSSAQLYVGGGLGWTKAQDLAEPNAVGATASTVSKDDNSNGWKLYGGYSFTPNIAIEGGYVDLGKFKATRNVTAPTVGSIGGESEVTGWFADAVGTFPVGYNASLLGRVGAGYMRTSVTGSTTGGLVPRGELSPSSYDWVGKLGFGGQYDFNKQVAARLEWERYFRTGGDETGKSDIDFVSLSLHFRF